MGQLDGRGGGRISWQLDGRERTLLFAVPIFSTGPRRQESVVVFCWRVQIVPGLFQATPCHEPPWLCGSLQSGAAQPGRNTIDGLSVYIA